MQSAQKVCRHLVVSGSISGERHMGQQRLSSTWERYVRVRRSRDECETGVVVIIGLDRILGWESPRLRCRSVVAEGTEPGVGQCGLE